MRFLSRPLLNKVGRRSALEPAASATVSAEPECRSSVPLLRYPVMSPREERVMRLSEEVFSKGNVHLKNVEALSALPEGLHSFPEVCFIGKPNVGKSTIISCLLHNHRLGRAGSTRGTTRLLQFFNVGDAVLLVDTPGYGGWKGRHLSQNLADRARAFGILFRYLALRKRGPLKRVYWVMEAAKPIQPRDEEIFAFLQEEQIPFSVIINKIDRYRDDRNALQHHVEKLWKLFGSAEVPVLGTRASPKYPERCLNLNALQHDITYYCTQELSQLNDLTYKNLKELSYAPPTVEEMNAVERRYPLESFILPQENNLSLERFVARHEEAKARCLSKLPKAALLSSRDEAVNCLLSSNDQEDNLIENDNTLGRASQTQPLLEEATPVAHPSATPITAIEATETPTSDSTTTTATFVEAPVRFHVRASLRAALGRHSNESNDDDKLRWDKAEVPVTSFSTDSSSSFISNTGKEMAPSLFREGSAPPVRAPIAPQLPPSMDRDTQTVRAINGVHIPKSMITVSVSQLPASQKDSFEYFAQHSGTEGYEQFLTAEAEGQHTFLEEGKHACFTDSEMLTLQRPLKKSERRKRLDRVLEKYLSRVRKDRSLYMQAEGYMCPWLAGAGQPSRVAVMGLAPGQFSIGRGGGLMKGLKRTGFGGKSYSADTMKNRGRATKKTGYWAA
ncbi:GTP-binding protein [Trypanosoma grayi]|uniref:GTP-binding protein n=1 Tax=Trypanosoma grayi TaxID=71804 RepID=UPI0004F47D18|nr:GTP-binding protein [Trypanosoma grayi]KEG14566.1 GTP-binding protein [Trypanosoma grayi]